MNWFSRLFNRKVDSYQSNEEGENMIAGTEKPLFEKALKLYIFAHHKPFGALTPQLAEQLKYTGNAVYSLLLNWMRDGKPSLEYMDFLNTKISELRKLTITQLNQLDIMPDEIDDLALSECVRLSFGDEETDRFLKIEYYPATGWCKWKWEF